MISLIKIGKIALAYILCIFFFSSFVSAQVYVKGYYRKDGTYVRPHVRSNPDGNPYNNWSFPGNLNPYIGKVATGNPETYLRNYHNETNNKTNEGSKNPMYKETGTARVNATRLNVRMSPSINGKVVGKLSYLDRVIVEHINAGWIYVEYSYFDLHTYRTSIRKGYVLTKYLNFD